MASAAAQTYPNLPAIPKYTGQDWHTELETILEYYAIGYDLRSIAVAYGIGITALWEAMRSPEYSETYMRAHELRAHLFAYDIVTLADSANERNAHAVRVRVDARKWISGKLLPRVFGDKLDVSHSGVNGESLPPQIQINLVASPGSQPLLPQSLEIPAPDNDDMG